MTFKSFVADIEKVPGDIAKFFTAHQIQIQTVISDAVQGVAAAIAVVGVVEPAATGVVKLLGGVAAGLAQVSTAVTGAPSDTTLTSQANALAGLTSSLVTSGELGVKSASSQAAVTSAITKTQAVIGALVTAAAASPAT